MISIKAKPRRHNIFDALLHTAGFISALQLGAFVFCKLNIGEALSNLPLNAASLQNLFTLRQ